MNKTLIIMAAGMGSRYGGLKQLDQIGPSGETIIEYSVFDALRAGFDKVVFVIRRDFEQHFKEQIGHKFEGRVRVEYVFQSLEDIPGEYTVPSDRAKPWGTGHALLSAAPVVHEPFVIINADDFYGFDAFEKLSRYLDSVKEGELAAALAGYHLKNTLSENGTVSRGVCHADSSMNLVSVEEVHGLERNDQGRLVSDTRKDLEDNTIISMNMWAFSPEVFDSASTYFKRFLEKNGRKLKSEFYIPLIVNTLIEEKHLSVRVLDTDSQWFGVTYRADKPAIVKAVRFLIEEGAYPKALF